MRMSKLFSAIGLLVVTLAITPPASGQNTQKLLKSSDMAFIGTVLEMHAVSFAGVEASPETMVVKVDKVLEKPAAIVLRAGDKITVAAKDPSQFRTGLQATFYCVGWVFGSGVALREVGHEVPSDPTDPVNPDQKQQEQTEVRKQIGDAELRARIQSAERVIVGRVTKVQEAKLEAAAATRVPISEHNPEWTDATIHVESTIKGDSSAQNVVVRFPASIDVMWYEAPKLKEGQEGTFFLQTDKLSGSPTALIEGVQGPVYMVPRPGDVMAKSEAERVRALSKE
jgi:hypothetical protein